ncbi:proton-conducting transporter transmembrane domain-containing protein [Mesoaciditoga sp.]
MVYINLAILFSLFGITAVFSKKIGYFMAMIASVFAFIAALTGLTGMNGSFREVYFRLSSNISMGIGLDKTSAFFLLLVSISWFALALYSLDYGKHFSKGMAFGLNIMFLGVLLTISARDAITFMIGWEIATIFVYLLMLERRSFKEIFPFMAFSEISTLFMFIAFGDLFIQNGTFSLDTKGTSLFLLFASLAFVVKMDIFPFHTWISKAYPKIPSSVNAMASVPITLMGTYGIVMALSISGIPLWWGITAMIFGGISAFWGGLQSVAAKWLKLLPAYSTVENNGMILTTLGLFATAYAFHLNTLGNFAMLTAFFLIFSHSVTKTLIFLSIGHAKIALDEESIDNVRGIWTSVGKIPAISLVISSLSFSAFPPLIGYVGEWMLLEAIFQSYKFPSMLARLTAAFTGIAIALAMGMAAFSMVKLAGYTALGYDHGKKAKQIHHLSMNIAELILTFVVVLAGLFSPLLVKFFGYKEFLSGLLGVPKPYLIVSSHPIFGVVSPTFLAVVLGVLGIFPLIFYFAKSKKVKRVDAWNGGEVLNEGEYFSAPAYSFTLEYILRKVYATREIKEKNKRYVSVKDIVHDMYTGLITGAKSTSLALSRTLMNGHVYSYILYILVVFVLIFFMVR